MQFLDLPFWREAIRGLMGILCNLIYSIMSFFYELFNIVATSNILTSTDVKDIYQRVTMILTIVMVFYITFQFVKYVVQPENMTDKEKGAGNLVYKMVIVVVLIAFVPKIFDMANDVQKTIINQNVISKVILGPKASVDTENIGQEFAANVLSMFYYVDAENTSKECHDGATCGQIVATNISDLQKEGYMSAITIGLNETDNSDVPLITFEFDGLLPIIVGAVMTWILVLYCIDVGVRWAQLLYLQLIAPIPILGYMSPKKDGIFQKWVKQCFTTYLDLFIRVAIINLILLLCDILLKARFDGGIVPEGTTGLISTLAYVVLIMGVMLFAHKAPKMLAELFPKSGAASGNFGLTAKDRGLKGATRVLGGAAGMAVGAAVGAGAGLAQGWRRSKALNKNNQAKGTGAGIWGATKGLAGGIVGGAARGLANGSKKGNMIKNVSTGTKNQIKASQRFGNREEQGYSFATQMEDRARSMSGMKSRTDAAEAIKAPIKRHNDALKKVEDTRSKIEKRAIDKINEGGKGGAAAQNYLGAQRRLKELQENQAVREKEFKVAKFTDDKKAQEAYDADVELAKASINKSNYIDPTTGAFNKEAYDKAVDAAVSKVNAGDYSVAYKTEEEAHAAYKAAVKSKTDGIDRNMFATEDDYNKALTAAASTVNAEIYTKGYASAEEAQAALGAEIQKQIKAVDEAKDAAVAEYVALKDKDGNVADGAIVQMLKELQTDVIEYNKTASTEEITTRDENGHIVHTGITRSIELASSEDIIKDFGAFSKEVKSGKINTAKNINATKIIEIDSEIERIKRQTANSGVNEGGKK